MSEKHIKTEQYFDREFFVVGDPYQIVDNKGIMNTQNWLLNNHCGTFLEFYNKDGDVLSMNVDEYIDRYDITRFKLEEESNDGVEAVEPTNTSYLVQKEYATSDTLIRDVNYKTGVSDIVWGDPKNLEVYKELEKTYLGNKIHIKPFYYLIEPYETEDDILIRARYYISDTWREGFKLHPLFKTSKDEIYLSKHVSKSPVSGAIGSSYDTIIKEIKEQYPEKVSLMSIEMLAALQLLILVELGPVGWVTVTSNGSYHKIKDLGGGDYAHYVSGLCMKRDELYLHDKLLFCLKEDKTGYIKCFKYFEPTKGLDWLFIPRTVEGSGDYGVFSFPIRSTDRLNHAVIGRDWWGMRNKNAGMCGYTFDTEYYQNNNCRLMYNETKED